MAGREVRYTFEGTEFVGWLAEPQTDAPRPGVLVCHEGPGMTDHPRWRAERLADELGVVAFALDYWGGGVPLPAAEVGEALGRVIADPRLARPRAEAGLAQLLAHPLVDPARVAAMGYCFGGTMAIDLARGGAPLVGAVGFHSGLKHPEPADARLTARVLAMIGADDPIVTAADRLAWEAEMTAAGVDWQLHVYGGVVHSFTNRNSDRDGFRYHEAADRRSWATMCQFFHECLGTPRI